MKALSRNYNFKLFSKNEVEEGFFDDVDMVVFPGGIGDSDSYDTILKNNKDVVVFRNKNTKIVDGQYVFPEKDLIYSLN